MVYPEHKIAYSSEPSQATKSFAILAAATSVGLALPSAAGLVISHDLGFLQPVGAALSLAAPAAAGLITYGFNKVRGIPYALARAGESSTRCLMIGNGLRMILHMGNPLGLGLEMAGATLAWHAHATALDTLAARQASTARTTRRPSVSKTL